MNTNVKLAYDNENYSAWWRIQNERNITPSLEFVFYCFPELLLIINYSRHVVNNMHIFYLKKNTHIDFQELSLIRKGNFVVRLMIMNAIYKSSLACIG